MDELSALAERVLPQLQPVLTGVVALLTVRFIINECLSRWHCAMPNEWLLLINNGKLVKCGIGMSCFCPPGAQVVRFPSTMQETTFTASQATKQRAGISVTGKAYWSIYRPNADDPDGPFRAFKSLAGLVQGDFTAGNEKVETLAISCIRDAVSKMNIVEVMTSREELKERVKGDITPIFRGWGMWLETVEIIDVRVESRTLFDDMQYLRPDELDFDTKADAHLCAEQAKLSSQRLLDTEKLNVQLEVSKKRADTSAEQGIYEATQSLKRDEGEAALEEARQQMRLARMEKEHALRMQQVADKTAVQNAELKQQLAMAKEKEAQEHELRQRRYELEATLTDTNIQMRAIDATKEIYTKLPLREVKLVSMGGADPSSTSAGASGLRSLLPAIGAGWEALNEGARNGK